MYSFQVFLWGKCQISTRRDTGEATANWSVEHGLLLFSSLYHPIGSVIPTVGGLLVRCACCQLLVITLSLTLVVGYGSSLPYRLTITYCCYCITAATINNDNQQSTRATQDVATVIRDISWFVLPHCDDCGHSHATILVACCGLLLLTDV